MKNKTKLRDRAIRHLVTCGFRKADVARWFNLSRQWVGQICGKGRKENAENNDSP